MTIRQMTLLGLLFALSGCAGMSARSPANEPATLGIDGLACVGQPPQALAGLRETTNGPLAAVALGASGKGGTCAAKVFSVNAPIRIYRVFDTGKPYSKLGRWWSLARPPGSREEYRAAFAICKEWNNLDRLISCEIRPGTEVVVGPTQSAQCADGTTYPKTADTQVFVPNDSRDGILHVGACIEEDLPW